jgi:hypothetical protein
MMFNILMMVLLSPLLVLASEPISPLIGFGQENIELGLGDINANKKEMKYKPNMNGITRLAVTAYGLTIGASFRGTEDLDRTYGNTTFSDYQLGYDNRKWGIDATYQVYKGFYTNDTNQTQLFPDLRFQKYALLGRLALEENDFSVGALVNQADEIKKTEGKYYLVGGFRQHVLENNISLLQQDYAGTNTDLEALRKMKVTSLNFGVGAGKYWVSAGHYFVGAMLDLLGTYGFYKYVDANEVEEMAQKSSLSFNAKFGAGYAGEMYKVGFSLSGDSTTLLTPGSSYMTPQALRLLVYLRLTFQ